MLINSQEFYSNELHYTIRSANIEDAQVLSDLRLQLDGETENFDREQGEGFIDTKGFETIIKEDSESPRNLCLVAVVDNRIVGFSRCAGSPFKRIAHKVEFGVGVLKEFWRYGIGKNFLKTSVEWADANDIKKMALHVVETNDKAILLYKKLGFEVEGVLKNDKLLSDGNYYNTIVMGRIKA
ncbi:N-acetyltransferase family protein [Lysinibacillus sp. NPDC093190]|uniref:GNAT family N-acetyltransferase n=1 Tax=Lysinibacillus sp. NPDC093190 TaxID=3390575 RepID=UPI003D0768E5